VVQKRDRRKMRRSVGVIVRVVHDDERRGVLSGGRR